MEAGCDLQIEGPELVDELAALHREGEVAPRIEARFPPAWMRRFLAAARSGAVGGGVPLSMLGSAGEALGVLHGFR